MKVLVADDEKNIRISIISMLQEISGDSKFSIEEAASGEQLLKSLSEYKPDVAFVDIKMPKMNGLEAIKEAKIISPNTKWIIITGFAEFEYAQEAINLGVSKFLLKPISNQQITSVLEELMLINSSGNSDYIEYAISYTKKHYTDNIGLSDISYTLGITPNYLGNLFYKKVGEKYNDYLAGIRLSEAKKLLLSTSLTIQEISIAVGFNSSKYFSKVFSKFENMSPSEYREARKYH